MGCPGRNVAHSGAGAALIKTPELAAQIIKATQLGIQQWQNGETVQDCSNITEDIVVAVEKFHQQLPEAAQVRREIPVSVETRVGYDQTVIDSWIPTSLETGI